MCIRGKLNDKVQFYMLLLLCFLVATSYMAVMELNDFKGVVVVVVVLLQFIMVWIFRFFVTQQRRETMMSSWERKNPGLGAFVKSPIVHHIRYIMWYCLVFFFLFLEFHLLVTFNFGWKIMIKLRKMNNLRYLCA